MNSDSTFKNLLSIITYFALPIGAIIWPFFKFTIPLAVFWILVQLTIIALLNLLIEKICDDDSMADLFAVILLILVFLTACYWPFVVCPVKLAVIIALIEVAVISIGLNLLTGGELDFLEYVFVIALSLLAAYWPWIICPFKPALIIFVGELGLIFLLVGAYIEVDAMRNIGIAVLAVLAVAWPWLFVKYNIAIIIILAELFLLALVYEIINSFDDSGIVLGMVVFLLMLAVGWPWLAFLGFEKYLWYAIPASIGSGIVAGFIAKLIMGVKD